MRNSFEQNEFYQKLYKRHTTHLKKQKNKKIKIKKNYEIITNVTSRDVEKSCKMLFDKLKWSFFSLN